jgi:hypothetical protein
MVVATRITRAGGPLQVARGPDDLVLSDRVVVGTVQIMSPLADVLGPGLNQFPDDLGLVLGNSDHHATRTEHSATLGHIHGTRLADHQQIHQVVRIRQGSPIEDRGR